MAQTNGLTITVHVEGIPEAIWKLRHEMANRLREAADAEALPLVSRKLCELAAEFEVGA